MPQYNRVKFKSTSVNGRYQGKRFVHPGQDSGGRRSLGAAQQVAACLVVAARPEPRPPGTIFAQIEKGIGRVAVTIVNRAC